MNIPSPADACPACSAPVGRENPRFPPLQRVTSDCRPWPAGGRLVVCPRCGMVHKPADEAFHAEIDAIYAGYAIYHQSGGAEQRSFDTDSGIQSARSARLIGRLGDALRLPNQGRLLDVGCGNGATLRAFSAIRPGWTSVGTELDDRHRAEVEAIPGASFAAGPLTGIDGRFDLVTLIHVLEHIVEPIDFLRTLAGVIAPGGHLLVEVPHHPDNPFELLIADHRSHFTTATLPFALATAGYEVDIVTDGWISRELSVVARPATGPAAFPGVDPDRAAAVIDGSLDWLRRSLGALVALEKADRPLGMFGTAIAGTWLVASSHAAVSFFVDEDPHRVGRSHLGRPILAPAAVPPGSAVFVGLPPQAAAAVAQRLATPTVAWIAPPP